MKNERIPNIEIMSKKDWVINAFIDRMNALEGYFVPRKRLERAMKISTLSKYKKHTT